jgi:hypothetical protein
MVSEQWTISHRRHVIMERRYKEGGKILTFYIPNNGLNKYISVSLTHGIYARMNMLHYSRTFHWQNCVTGPHRESDHLITFLQDRGVKFIKRANHIERQCMHRTQQYLSVSAVLKNWTFSYSWAEVTIIVRSLTQLYSTRKYFVPFLKVYLASRNESSRWQFLKDFHSVSWEVCSHVYTFPN